MKYASAALGICLLLGALPRAVADNFQDNLKKLPPAASGKIDFRKDVEPIFREACIACHGPEKQRGGLRLDNGSAAQQGGNSGPVVVPGKAIESKLLRVVAGLDPDVQMPPRGKAPLSTAEVATLRAWIDQGATWPAQETATRTVTSMHWAFQPLRRPELPRGKQASWVRNGIDAFILARLEREGMTPSPEANRATLARRLSFDLLGLPPSPQDVDAFVNDLRSDAYERFVDRLLASPHYGERWARHWLDLARYADSDGYEQDRPRPFAWRYREWVIGALNSDLPFDRFTIEQLASDLLPGATLAQKAAMGFHRNTLTNREGGTDKEQFRVEACIDRVNTTAKAFLGLTLGCAQCHDHKYDPFSQREYYQLFAFFNSDNEVDLPAPLPGEAEKHRKARTEFERKKKELQGDLAQHKKTLKPDQLKKEKKLATLKKALATLEKSAPKEAVVATLALGPGRTTHVLLRGDFLRPGVKVRPGTPAVLPPLQAKAAVPTRLDLAEWIVASENPLTPRVIANWVWQRYFGRGLVATLEDFGTQGEAPSHPELLDYLAAELVCQHWSLKELHQRIVTSATYRQSSRHRPELAGRDPLNRLLARQNRLRLEAESLRDNALAVSGLLVRTVGGPSVKPPQPAGISELTYAGTAKWVESKGTDRYRRGLYTWFQRTSPYPMLMTFDAPDSNLSCVRREKSNTPLQALTLLNDAVFVECSQALARRVLAETPRATLGQRVEQAFRRCLARPPAAAEREALARLYDDLLALARANPQEVARLAGAKPMAGGDPAEAAAWVALARALMNLDEFVTRE